jgi:hypothetical protein
MIDKFLQKFLRTKLKSQIVYSPELETLHAFKKQMGFASEYYDENFENTRSIVDAIHDRYRGIKPLHFLVVGQMQSGKTNNIKCFLETSCGKIPVDSRLFTCGDGDRAIFNQNVFRLEKVIHVKSLVKFNRDVRNGKANLEDVKLLVLDEDQFAQGENSQVHILLKRLYNNYPDLIVLRITGTPGGMSSYGFKTIKMKTGPGYVGPGEFLQRGQIKDIRQCYLQGGLYYGKKDPYFYTDSTSPGVTSIHIKDHLKEELTRLVDLNGYGCMRYTQPDVAKREISSYAKTMGWDIEILIAHQNPNKSGHTKSITEVLQDAWTMSVVHNRTVLVIFENALKAGFDFDANTPKQCRPIKDRLVFFYELTDSNWNSHLQGGPGRCSGYHNNTNVHIYANTELVQLYADWEQGIISHEELDFRISQIDRAKFPNSTVNPATNVKSRRTDLKMKTWMTAIKLEQNVGKQLLKMRSKLNTIGNGFEPEPLIDLVETFVKDNAHTFGLKNPETHITKSEVIHKGKSYYMNGRTWSNHKPEERHKFEKDLEKIINHGRIGAENVKNHRGAKVKMNVALFTYDNPKLPHPEFYLCLLNGEVSLPGKEYSLEDRTFYTDPDLQDKY